MGRKGMSPASVAEPWLQSSNHPLDVSTQEYADRLPNHLYVPVSREHCGQNRAFARRLHVAPSWRHTGACDRAKTPASTAAAGGRDGLRDDIACTARQTS